MILIEKIINKLESLNQTIAGDEKYLGSGYKIGHSYFCPDSNIVDNNEAWYRQIIKYEIEPLLKEYWFDDIERAEQEVDNLIS